MVPKQKKLWYRSVLSIALAGNLIFAVGAPAQTIESFDIGSAPVSVAIVVETSSRVQALLPAIRRTGILFTQNVLGPNGEATLIGYNDEVDRLMDFTSDDDEIEKAVKDIQMGTSGNAPV